MDDGLDAVQRQGIARDVGLDEPKPGKRSQAGEIALFDVTRVERVEVIDPGHFVPPPHERLAHMRSDESGGAGDQKPVRHPLRPPPPPPSCPPISLKTAIVRPNPSSSDTFGSHPSVLRACVMSGWRTRGSSTGSGRSTILLLLPVNSRTRSASCRTVNSLGLPILVGSEPPRSNSRTIPSIK